jgi:hypothetical protein
MSTLNVDKVDPSSGTALELGTSGDTITVPSGATFVVAGTTEITGTNNVQRPNAQPFIINGDMVVAQRSTSVTGKTSSGFFTCDRLEFVANDAGTWTIIQETQTTGSAYDNGLKEAYRMDCTTADASVAADSILYLKYKMEGFNVQEFKKGTSNAETYTLSFWVKSNVTGTGQVNMRDETNNRMCSATYTTDVADTWEKKVLNFAADTSGASACTNAEALAIEWMVAAGTNYTSGAAPTAWETIAATDRAAAVTLALSGSTSNDFSITGVQLEVGTYTSSTIPPFQFESYGDNLQRCYRYYKHIGSEGDGYINIGFYYNSTNLKVMFRFGTPFRATPAIVQNTVSDQFTIYFNNGYDSVDDFSLDGGATGKFASIYNDSDASGTGGMAGGVQVGTGSLLAFEAEL